MNTIIDEQNQESSNKLKILVVDDQPINIQLVYNILAADYNISAATNGDQAIDACLRDPPDLILLDVVMPNMSGIETCIILKQRLATADIPVIFVTSYNQQEEENICWESGAVDFISKPINPTALKNRVKAHLSLKLHRDLLENLIFKDDLTGVFNRRYFEEHIDKYERQCNRDKNDSALLLLDIDNFSDFNKTFGSIRGDIALKDVAQYIQEQLMRPTDFVARLQGGLFAVVLPNTDISGAIAVGNKIKQCVVKKEISYPNSTYNIITLSLGISTVLLAQQKMVALVEDAEQYLLQAKQGGGNITKHPKVV